jgi:FKBP-type peptidyl-prolyl cis-trans isomerase
MSEKYYGSKTPGWQRWIIWVIAIIMFGGTILTYVVILVANNNTDANPNQIAYNKYLEKLQKEQEEAVAKQKEVEAKYVMFDEAYKDKIGEFVAAEVTELTAETLKEGDGEVATGTDTISANYTGWDATGRIFDTTRKTAEGEAAPIEFSLMGVIQGWTQGLTGKKVGGVYYLTIPASLAYGEGEGVDASGRPLGPLRFVVEIKSVVSS